MADQETTRPFADLGRHGERAALIWPGGAVWSHRELAERADAWAQSLGPQRGVVAIEMANAAEPIVALIGACRAGFPVLVLDPGRLAREPRLRERFRPEYEFGRDETGWVLSRGASVVAAGDEAPASELHPELAWLLATSGSTGSPKLVRLSGRNVVSNAAAIAEYLNLGYEDRAITSLPLHYSYGLSVLTSHLWAGGALVVSDHAVHEPEFWADFELGGATGFAGVPLMFETLASLGFLEKRVPGLRLMTQAGGRLRAEWVRRFARFAREQGARFYVMYGQTEAAPRMAYLPPELAESEADCIGRAIPGGRFWLRDAAGGEIAAAFTPGELVYRGPNVMMGYAQERADLARGAEGDELATGDIAERNDIGLYRVLGRTSRFVKIAGLRIALDGIEEDLAAAGWTARVAGSDRGIAIAVVGAADGEDADGARLAELREQWVRRLGVPPRALQVVVVATLPVLTNGKVDYAELRRLGETKGAKEVGLAAEGGTGSMADGMVLAQECAGGDGVALRAELAQILGRRTLADDETFVSAGGDSLNLVEGALAVERCHGRRVPGWECMTMATLCPVEGEGVPLRGRDDPLLVARAAAIWLAMSAHVVFKFDLWRFVPKVLVPTAWATPLLLVVFGWGLARRFAGSRHDGGKPPGVRAMMAWCWPMAVTYYGAIAITVLAQALSGEMTWREFAGALIFNRDGIYAGIWMMYCWMMLLAPFLVGAILRGRVWGTILVLVLPWWGWRWLSQAPEINYFWGFLVGWGSVTGPSVLHATTLVVLGFLLGAVRRSGQVVVLVAVLTAVSVWMLLRQIDRLGLELVWQLVAFQEYRRLNHPAYIAFGVVGALGICGLGQLIAKFPWLTSVKDVLLSFGRSSIFAYTFGNLVLTFTPDWDLGLGEAMAFGVIFLGGLALLTDDITRWRPRVFGGVARWLRRQNLRLLRLVQR